HSAGSFRIFFPDNRDHSDSHVKYLVHFRAINLSLSLQECENRRHPPAFRLDPSITIAGQNPRYIIDKSAAGNMSKATEDGWWQLRQERLVVSMHPQKFFA